MSPEEVDELVDLWVESELLVYQWLTRAEPAGLYGDFEDWDEED